MHTALEGDVPVWEATFSAARLYRALALPCALRSVFLRSPEIHHGGEGSIEPIARHHGHIVAPQINAQFPEQDAVKLGAAAWIAVDVEVVRPV